jgi:hypothetical protein
MEPCTQNVLHIWDFSSVELVRVVNHERLFRGLSQRLQFAIASKNTNGFDTTHSSLYVLLL